MACIFSAHLHSNEMKFTSNPGRVCFVVMMEVREFDWEPRASVPSRPSYDTFLGTTVPNTIPKKGIYISAPKEPKKNDFTRENLISYKPQKKSPGPDSPTSRIVLLGFDSVSASQSTPPSPCHKAPGIRPFLPPVAGVEK